MNENTTRFSTGIRFQAVSFFRKPLNLILMLVIPILVIESYAVVLEGVPSSLIKSSNSGRITGALFSVAFLTGLFGLFQAINSGEADKRLVLTGYPRPVLLASRIATIFGVSTLVAALSYGAFVYSADRVPEAPVTSFIFLISAGLIYGMIGVLIGTAIPRELEGSLVLVFVADADSFFSTGFVELDSAIPKAFPLHYPHSLFESTVTGNSYGSEEVFFLSVYLVVLLLAVTAVFLKKMQVKEGWI